MTSLKKHHRINVPRPAILVLLFFVLLISHHFRTHRIAWSPGWFRDEGTYLEVAQRIGKAQLQLGAVNITFVGPNMTHPPLYFMLANIYLKMMHVDMYSFRMFNAMLGVIATLLCFLLGHEAGRLPEEREKSTTLYAEVLGLVTAAIFAIHPDAVAYNRMGLPYNLYMIEVILVAFFALRYLRTRDFFWFLCACITASLSLITIYYSLVFIPFLFLCVFVNKKLKHLWALAATPAPLIIFLVFMSFSDIPGFHEDINALRRAAEKGSLYVTLIHYSEFFQTGLSYFLGLAGLILIKRKINGRFLIFLYILLIHIVLRKADTIIKFIHYPVIPLLPLVALGCAAIAIWAFEKAASLSVPGLLVIPVLLAVFLCIQRDRHGIHDRFYTRMDFMLTRNTADNMMTMSWVNTHSDRDDVVLSSTTLWAGLDAKTSDLAQALAWEGKRVGFYKHTFPRERFLFSPAVENARYVIMDIFTDQWAQSPPGSFNAPIAEEIERIEENWPKVFKQGEFRVYENPLFHKKTEKEKR